MMMGRCRILFRMALQAEPIAGHAQLGAMWLVTVAACHASGKHLALLERTIIIHLVEHLTVDLIKPTRQQRHCVCVGEPMARNPIFREFAAARVAQPACLHFLAEHSRRYAALGLTRDWISVPGHTVALGEAHQQAHVFIVDLAEWPPALLILRPGDVTRALSMTSLAADTDLGPGRSESVMRRVIVLAHAGRVALGAHKIPILVELGPVEDVVVADFLVRVEMEPVLAAVRL